MWNIIFTVMFSMAATGVFEDAPTGWKIVSVILTFIAQVILLHNDVLQEKLQDRTKSLEKKLEKLEKLVGEDK